MSFGCRRSITPVVFRSLTEQKNAVGCQGLSSGSRKYLKSAWVRGGSRLVCPIPPPEGYDAIDRNYEIQLRNQGGCVVEIGEHLSVLYYGRSSVQDSSYGQVTQSHHSAPFEQRPAFFELAEVAVSKGYRYRPKRPGAGGYLRLC